MISPMMSLVVVINGPVAKAGSIPNRFNVSGMYVPEILANTITLKSAILAVILMLKSK